MKAMPEPNRVRGLAPSDNDHQGRPGLVVARRVDLGRLERLVSVGQGNGYDTQRVEDDGKTLVFGDDGSR
jgi:hypothetical protein